MAKVRVVRTIGAAAVVVVLGVLSASGASASAPWRARGAGELRDLMPATVQPTDGATAQVVAVEEGSSTHVTLKVQGLDHGAAGTELGAHIHIGQCVAGNGAAALGHYNAGGGISDQTEVWLDFTIQANGTAQSETTVPFRIPAGGAGALVIHAAHTDHTTGAAGARWACLPVPF